ncbi:MAG TPA: carbonic anhydrase [Thermohalobaculum sp.]|nr:carbonic anhydrase [Thermohalobaculum sp.]
MRYAAPLPHYLKTHHATWRERVYEPDRAWYARLATGGQRPRAMLISCCDSRFDAVQTFGAEPGDLFVVRNVAALVPPYDPDHGHHGTSAAVEFAVTALKVAHIVVVGHSDCGGVRACAAMCSGREPAFEKRSSFVGRWMDILRPGYERVAGTGEQDPEALQTPLEHEAVLTSLRNLETFPFVSQACDEGVLTLHGCWFDIGTGALEVYDPGAGAFR